MKTLFGLLPVLTLFIFGHSVQGLSEETALASPVPLKVTLPPTLLDSKSKVVPSHSMEGKLVGLYFSASWCGPCRAFTPSLIKFRDAHKEKFEVVLVGADGSAKAQSNYMKKYKMPWLALENQSRAAKEISKSLGVSSIPCLVVLDTDGNVLSKNGKNEIARTGEGAMSVWKKLAE